MAGPGPLSPEELRAYYAMEGGASMPPPAGPSMSTSPAAAYYAPEPPPPPPTAPIGPPVDYSKMSPADQYAAAMRAQTPVHTGAMLGAGPPIPPGEQSAFGRAFSSPEPLFQNPFKSSPATPPAAPPPPAAAPPSPETPIGPPPPPAVGGPTPEDDRAFAAFRSGQDSAAKPAAPSGGGGTGSADPFGKRRAQKDLLGTFGEEQEGLRRVASIEAQQSLARTEMRSNLAREQAEDAAIEQETARFHRETLEKDLNEVRSQLDAVKSKQVDPLRYEREHGGPVVTAIGGLIGGLYQGLNRLEKNPFLERLDRNIQDDIGRQERELGRQRGLLGDQANLVGQMRAIYKDDEMARLQARNLYYQAVQQQIEAKAGEYDSPAILARAELGANAVARARSTVEMQIAEKAEGRAAAASAARRAELWKEREYRLKAFGADTDRMKAEAEVEGKVGKVAERFVATGQDAQGAPTGYLARDAASAAKAEERRTARTQVRDQVNRALALRDEQGMLGRTLNRESVEGVGAISPAVGAVLPAPEWQTKIRSIKADLTKLTNKAGGLGAYDAGTATLLDQIIGDLESRGGQSDTRLRELLTKLDEAERADQASAAGAQARKVVGPDGREHIEVTGAQAAPTNPRAVRREAP